MTTWGTIVAPQQFPPPSEVLSLDDVILPEVPAESASSAPNLAGGIRALYQKCHFYDVFIVCGSSRFPAHQAVLAAASPKFCHMLLEMQSKLQADEDSIAAAKGGDQVKHPELHLPGTYSAPTLSTLLDFVYNLGDYSPAGDEANVEVMRLATELDLPALKARAAQWLAEHLTVENAIAMLAICEEFALTSLSEKIKDQLASDTQTLLKVTQQVAATKHPHILQNLLMRVATRNSLPQSPPEKREAPNSPPSPEKEKREAPATRQPSPEKEKREAPATRKSAKQAGQAVKRAKVGGAMAAH